MAISAKTELKIDGKTLGDSLNIVDVGDGFAEVVAGSPFSDYALCEFSLEAGLLRPTVFRFKIRKKELGRNEDKIKLKDPITNNILGKKVSCKVTTNEHAGDLEFKGTVLEAEADKLYITGTAYSADYVLNDAPCCKSYLDQSLKEVICDIIGQRLDPLIDSIDILKKKIGYIVRYNETSYQFLTRLARQYGLYFWIEDNVLFVCQNKPYREPIDMDLRTDSGYTGFTYKLKTKFPKPAYMVLDDNDCKNWHKWNILDGDDINAEAMVKRVNNLSKSFFSINDNDPPKLYYDYSVYHNQKIDTEGVNGCFESNENWLNSMVQRHTSSLRSQYVECTLTTHRANLRVGDIIVIKEKIIENNRPATKNHEDLMVVGLKYTWDATGNFVGKVTAIPNVCIAPPYFDPEAYPKSGVQRAKVVDNKDVKKMGRVKVQFVWQGAWLPAEGSNVTFAQGNNESPWIPVAHPYASSSGTGCFVIPEIGDEVLVGFEHDNVEKPYVIGVLYHGVEGENANKKDYKPDDKWADYTAENKGVNVVKALRTRSGQTIEIHDDNSKDENNKKGFVRIYTNPLAQNNGGVNNNNGNNNGNAAPREYDIVLSKDDWRKANDIDKALKAADAEKVKIGVASDGSIVISCAENLVLKAKNIKIIADETFDMSVAGKTGGKWNDDKDWKDTEFGTKMAIAKEKMEILAVGKEKEKKGVKMYVPAEKDKAAQTFSLTVGNSSVIVNGTKDKEAIGLVANESSYISVIADKDKNGIGLQANKDNYIAVNGKDNKIDVKAKESLVTIDGKNGAERIDVKAKGSYVTVDGKNGAEKIDVKAKESGVTVDGNGKAIVIKTDGSITLNGDGNISVKGKKLEMKGTDDASLEGSTDLKLKGANASLEGSTDLKLKGANASLEGSTDLKLKGANASLEGSRDLKLKGAEAEVQARLRLKLKSNSEVSMGGSALLFRGQEHHGL